MVATLSTKLPSADGRTPLPEQPDPTQPPPLIRRLPRRGGQIEPLPKPAEDGGKVLSIAQQCRECGRELVVRITIVRSQNYDFQTGRAHNTAKEVPPLQFEIKIADIFDRKEIRDELDKYFGTHEGKKSDVLGIIQNIVNEAIQKAGLANEKNLVLQTAMFFKDTVRERDIGLGVVARRIPATNFDYQLSAQPSRPSLVAICSELKKIAFTMPWAPPSPRMQ